MLERLLIAAALCAASVLLAACGRSGPEETADQHPAEQGAGEQEASAEEEHAPPGDPCGFPHGTEIAVSDADSLSEALKQVEPGTLIRLRAGVYEGQFEVKASGTEDHPIVLCGARDSVLNGGSIRSGDVFHFDNADHWILSGFTVTRGKKGVMLDESSGNLLTGLAIYDIGEEAVHFRRFSRDNTISFSEINDTGELRSGVGEGVYIGSAVEHWEDITGSRHEPDASDGNQVLDNAFGSGITAEHVDIKEGTAGGTVRGNTFDGASLSGENSADSWMDVKGNDYLIADNSGVNSPNDGFQAHARVDGWGNGNVFDDNLARVNGPGYGFSIEKKTQGNVVRCDNKVENARSGFANIACES